MSLCCQVSAETTKRLIIALATRDQASEAHPALSQDLDKGADIYATYCAACHGASLEGGRSSSFLDGMWNHGSGPGYHRSNIKHGIVDTEMIAWGKVLSDAQIGAVLGFILEKEKEGGVKPPQPRERSETEHYKLKVEILAKDLNQPWAFWDLMPTFTELSGATPPAGYETDGHSLVDYLKGGDVPARDYFYWELHLGDRPVQAARFGDWKAVRNGFDQPIEIYDLTTDSAETKNLADLRPDLVKQAATILKDAHRLDPNWPLDHRPEAHTQSAKTAWEIKRQRDKDQWIPENAIKLDL